MSGFTVITGQESIMYSDNASFDGTKRDGKMTSDGQMWIGSAISPHVRLGTLGSSDSSITWTVGNGTLTGQVAGGSTVGKTITGNIGGAISPVAGNWNVLSTGSLQTAGSGNTLTTSLVGLTSHALLVGAGTDTIAKVGPTATAGQYLQSAGAAAHPAFSTATLPSTATGTGTILRADGTNWVPTTATFPATTTINEILYSSANNVIGGVTAANNAVLVSSSMGVPSWSSGTNGNSLMFASGVPVWKNGIKTTTYIAADTWTPDASLKFAKIYMWNGGGGGGSGRCGVSASSSGGGGGGAGFFAMYEVLASNLQSGSYAITIGAGGIGGIAINAVTTNGNPGAVGGLTSVGVIICLNSNRNIQFNSGSGGTTSSGSAGLGYCQLVTGTYSTTTANGGVGTPGTPAASADGKSDIYQWATGGAGGAGYTSGVARIGAIGGNIMNGDWGTILVAGGLAGANTGAIAGNGNSPNPFELFIGGTGGGSGGHDGVVAAGTGGNGAAPAGGGGGGAGNLSSNPSGAGGDGGRGQVIIVEFL